MEMEQETSIQLDIYPYKQFGSIHWTA